MLSEKIILTEQDIIGTNMVMGKEESLNASLVQLVSAQRKVEIAIVMEQFSSPLITTKVPQTPVMTMLLISLKLFSIISDNRSQLTTISSVPHSVSVKLAQVYINRQVKRNNAFASIEYHNSQASAPTKVKTANAQATVESFTVPEPQPNSWRWWTPYMPTRVRKTMAQLHARTVSSEILSQASASNASAMETTGMLRPRLKSIWLSSLPNKLRSKLFSNSL